MPDTAITLSFAGVDRRFWLAMPQVIEIERRAGRSIFAIYEALGRGGATVGEVHDVVALALEGAVSRPYAPSLLPTDLAPEHFFPVVPLADGLQLAWCILHAAISGVRLRSASKSRNKPQPFRKGQILSNCGSLHLDWQQLSLSGYLECLEAHADANSNTGATSEPKGPSDPERLRRFMAAHQPDRGEKLAAVMAARAG